MNIHLVQDEMSAAELSTLMDANNHYVVPKDGSPLRGLIQVRVFFFLLLISSSLLNF